MTMIDWCTSCIVRVSWSVVTLAMTWESHVAEVTNDMTPTNKITIAALKMLFITLKNIKVVINISLCRLCMRFVLQTMNLGDGMTQNQLKNHESTKLDGWFKTGYYCIKHYRLTVSISDLNWDPRLIKHHTYTSSINYTAIFSQYGEKSSAQYHWRKNYQLH